MPGSRSPWPPSMCWSSGMVYSPTRRVSCPSRWLSLVCKIPVLLFGLSETNTIDYGDSVTLQVSALHQSTSLGDPAFQPAGAASYVGVPCVRCTHSTGGGSDRLVSWIASSGPGSIRNGFPTLLTPLRLYTRLRTGLQAV